jgi:pyrroline-5-carboxylate reductase
MREERSVGFIGAGNIAEAMIRGLITSGWIDPGQITISDQRQKRLIAVHESLGPVIAWSNEDNAARSRILFLTVKPAQVAAVAHEIGGALGSQHFVVSVAAGTSLRRIRDALGGAPRLCRIMPNLSAGVRRSTIGLYAEPDLPRDALAPVLDLLGQLGRVFRIEDEAHMAVVTALSGSAPAYYVMMAEALVRYGVSQGIPEELATSMILGTMEGSAAWALGAQVPLGELWRKVITPGGTTEAGMSYYSEKGFIETFVEGLARSTERARELGDK